MKYNKFFVFIVIGILISCSSYIIYNTQEKISTNIVNAQPVGEIVKGTFIYQEIQIPKKIKKYGIVFATYNRENKAKIKVKIKQDEVEQEEIIDTSKLKDNKLRNLNLNLKKYKPGKAELTIEGIDGEIGQSVTIYDSEDISLGKMNVNGQKTNRGIIQEIEYTNIDRVVKIQIIFTIFVVILLFSIMNCIKNGKNRRTYFLTILLIYLLVTIKSPITTIYAEPYAEIVTNFFVNANAKSFAKNIFLMDAGYLPLYQRILSLIIVKIFKFSPKIAVIVMQNIAVIILSFISSMFVLKEYSKYGNIYFRFIICIILGGLTIVPYTESHTFINFGYFNLIAIILISLLNFEEINRKKYILILFLTVFLCISKSYFIILLPISVTILLIIGLVYRKLTKRQMIYISIIAISTMVQTVYIFKNRFLWIKNDKEVVSILDILNNAIHQTVQQVIFLFYPFTTGVNVWNLNIIFLLILFFLTIMSLYFLYKYRNKESLIQISLLALIFGTTLFNVMAKIWFEEVFWTKSVGSINSRHSFFINISIIFFVIFFIYNFLQDEKRSYRKEKVYLIFGAMIFIRFLIFDNNNSIDIKESFSDWRVYSKFYQEKEYIVPLNPNFWYIFKNVKVHYIGHKTPETEKISNEDGVFLDSSIQQVKEINFTSPMYISHLFLTRVRVDNNSKLKIIGYDISGNVIIELNQLNRKERKYVGFRNYKMEKIAKIRIFDENSEEAYVLPEIIIGEPKN